MAAEQALRYGIERARSSGCQGCWYSNGGAIVAMDPRDGSIRAMASYPTYRPSLYVGRVRQDPSIDGNRGLAFWVVSDNLRKGAASNAVELAEVLVERGWIRRASARQPVGAGGRTA